MADKKEIAVGTRMSKLALAQSEYVLELLKKKHPQIDFKIHSLETKGDKNLSQPLSEIGDKGLFTDELEALLLSGGIRLAVHSLKDLPTCLPPDLCVGSISLREDPRDAVVLHSKYKKEFSQKKDTISFLPEGAVVGTSSLRRAAQLKRKYPHITTLSVRGNIQTRLRKLEERPYDAIVLAAAGLSRGGLADNIDEFLDVETCTPAVGQGALGIEIKEGDEEMKELLSSAVTDFNTLLCCSAERAFLRGLEGGCQAPIAGHCTLEESSSSLSLSLSGRVLSLDGSSLIEVKKTVSLSLSLSLEEKREGARKVGEEAAGEAKEKGAKALIDAARKD